MNENKHDYSDDRRELLRYLFDTVFYPSLYKIAKMQENEEAAKEYTNKLQPRYQVYDILFNGVVDEICNYYNKKEGENNG